MFTSTLSLIIIIIIIILYFIIFVKSQKCLMSHVCIILRLIYSRYHRTHHVCTRMYIHVGPAYWCVLGTGTIMVNLQTFNDNGGSTTTTVANGCCTHGRIVLLQD